MKTYPDGKPIKLISNKRKVEEVIINESNIVDLKHLSLGILIPIEFNPTIGIQKRVAGNLRDRALYLPSSYDYKLVLDDTNAICLIVLNKSYKYLNIVNTNT